MKKAALIACAASVLVLGGCQKKVGGQVVAVVNGEEITQQELNAELAGVNVPAGVDRKVLMAQVLQRVIDRELIVAKAKEQGLDKSPTYLAQIDRAKAGLLSNLLVAKLAKNVAVPDAADATRFMTENPSLFAGRKRYQLDQLVFAASNAQPLAAKLQMTKSLADIEQVLKDAGVQFQKTTASLDSATLPPAVAAKIASLPAGNAFIVPQGERMIASVVRSAEPVPVTPQQAQPVAVELLRRQSVEQLMAKQVKQARAAAKIDYAAGFTPPKPGAAPAP